MRHHKTLNQDLAKLRSYGSYFYSQSRNSRKRAKAEIYSHKFTVSVLLLTTVIVAGAGADQESGDWEYWAAEPQKFEVFDDYVIAVGTGNRLEPVQRRDIITEHRPGRTIKFRDVEIIGSLDFARYLVNKDAFFVSTTFSNTASFAEAKFLGMANFMNATFTKGPLRFPFMQYHFLKQHFVDTVADFQAAKLSGLADFTFATFSGKADFRGATFSGEADFRGATFSGEADFRGATFRKEIFFTFELLEGHIVYDEVFFRNLIGHYQDTGWLNLADGAYYLYRRERRRTLSPFYRIAELVFLEVPFGYGVKPLMLLRSFLVLWVPFSVYYALCLRCKPNHKLLYEESSGARWLLRSFRDKWWRLSWGLLHSFDALTPGIELYSVRSLKQSRYQFNEESKWITWVGRVQKFLGWYLLALFLILFGNIWIR